MPAERTFERLRRILVMVPWVMANPGATVDEVCERFGVGREQLSADLELLFLCGLPPFGPGDLIVAYIEGDRVEIDMADYLAEPPPLTRDEAIALLVTGRALERLPGFEEADALRTALDKLAAAISPTEADHARALSERIAVELSTPGADLLADVRRAIEERERLHIVYYSAGRDEMSERDVDPLVVFSGQGQWYLVAFDHLSAEERLFRLDRVKDAAPTGARFELSEGFDPRRYEDMPLFTPSPRDIEAVIDISPQAAWIREVVPLESVEERDDGSARVTLRTPHLAWLVRLLLSAGPGARAIAPDELVREVREAAQRALAPYGS